MSILFLFDGEDTVSSVSKTIIAPSPDLCAAHHPLCQPAKRKAAEAALVLPAYAGT
jgi:hypothetical protein